jgi:hypothetical protein
MKVTLVVGCARSGTSILGELIASHPDVMYVFEAVTIWEQGGMGENESHRLTAAHATPDIKEAIHRWAETTGRDALMLVEKSPRNILRIPYVREIFPQARIIHIVRDGRDVACSMVPGCGRDEWSHLRPPSWKTFFDRYSGPTRCAIAWKEIMEIGLQDLANVPHVQIRYEDLIASPESVARQIFDYMGLDMRSTVGDFCRRISNDTASPHHARHQDHWYRNDHEVRIGRWQKNLSASEKREINTLLAPLLDHFGYPVDSR